MLRNKPFLPWVGYPMGGGGGLPACELWVPPTPTTLPWGRPRWVRVFFGGGEVASELEVTCRWIWG